VVVLGSNPVRRLGSGVLSRFWVLLTRAEGQVLGPAVHLLLPAGPDGREHQEVVLPGAELPQRVRPLLAIGQEAAARVEAARHVHHVAVWERAGGPFPGDEGGA